MVVEHHHHHHQLALALAAQTRLALSRPGSDAPRNHAQRTRRRRCSVHYLFRS
jgi:hypothetical protein